MFLTWKVEVMSSISWDIQFSNVFLSDVVRLIKRHNMEVGPLEIDAQLHVDDFLSQHGDRDTYDGDDVLTFLGY